MSTDQIPLVGIVIGSDSDWPKINKATQALAEYATTAVDRGLKVILAAAGGAAHLAGVVAAHTTFPVVGLPVPTPDLGELRAKIAQFKESLCEKIAAQNANLQKSLEMESV